MKPLIMASSLNNLKSLFLGLPDCGFGVTVPISINPKPKLENWLINLAFLSKPAAKPTGLGKSIPKSLVLKTGWLILKYLFKK